MRVDVSLKDTIITLKNKKIIADLQAELESDKKNFIASKLLGPQAVGSSSSVVKVADVAGPIVQSDPKKSGGNMAPMKQKPQARKQNRESGWNYKMKNQPGQVLCLNLTLTPYR